MAMQIEVRAFRSPNEILVNYSSDPKNSLDLCILSGWLLTGKAALPDITAKPVHFFVYLNVGSFGLCMYC